MPWDELLTRCSTSCLEPRPVSETEALSAAAEATDTA
jgi:hypothetical protein